MVEVILLHWDYSSILIPLCCPLLLLQNNYNWNYVLDPVLWLHILNGDVLLHSDRYVSMNTLVVVGDT